MNADHTKPKIVGIGGIFFRSPGKQQLENWYRDKLGIDSQPNAGAMLPWRAQNDPNREHLTVWSVFPQDSEYFGSPKQSFMINYIVEDLDGLLIELEAAGVRIDPKRENHEYGKFAWIYDPDGNKIELWQP